MFISFFFSYCYFPIDYNCFVNLLGKTRVLIDNAGLTKPDEVVEILALYYWPKAPSPLLQTEIKVPFFFLQVAPFLQMIFVLC
jgi:hypothetical protein